MVTADYVHENASGRTTASEQATVINGLGTFNFKVEEIGEPIMAGDDPWYVSAVNHLDSRAFGPRGTDGISIFTIVTEGGTLKISSHVVIGRF